MKPATSQFDPQTAAVAHDAWLEVGGDLSKLSDERRALVTSAIRAALPEYLRRWPKAGKTPKGKAVRHFVDFQIVYERPEWSVFCRFCGASLTTIGHGRFTVAVMKPIYHHTTECGLRFLAGYIPGKAPRRKRSKAR